METRTFRATLRAMVLAGLALLPGTADAATQTVRLATQFGISYLPLTIMEKKGLLESHAKALGLDVTTEWLRFTGGSSMNDALLSGSLDFASGGVGPMLTIWGKTRSNLGVKAVAALDSMPLDLVTSNPAMKTAADFTNKDKIALPGVKTSIQAIVLSMAAEKAFGPGGWDKLDPLTVSMGHPDAQAALLSGKSEIDAHFTAAPFMYQELDDTRIHKVLDSYQVLGGPHTFIVVWATTRFHNANPKIVTAFVAALEEAEDLIKTDPAQAAAIYMGSEKTTLTAADVEHMIKLPENEWTVTPKKVLDFAAAMNRFGLVAAKTSDWHDIFFTDIGNVPGS